MVPFVHDSTRKTSNARYSCGDTRNACRHHFDMESIHQRINRLRVAKRMTLEDIAKRVGVSWQTVQQWEREDGTAPNRGRQQAVADALGISVAYLLTGSGTTGAEPVPADNAYDLSTQESAPCEVREVAAAYAVAPDEVKSAIRLFLRLSANAKHELHVVESTRDTSDRGRELDNEGSPHPFFPNTVILSDEIRAPGMPKQRSTD